MKINIINIAFGALSLFSLLSACSYEEEWTVGKTATHYLQIEGEIVGSHVAATKVVREDPLNLSFVRFGDGDRIGFFSEKEAPSSEFLNNEPLTYSMQEKKFTSSRIEEITLHTLGVTFAYYPYSDEACKYMSSVEMDDKQYLHIFTEENNLVDLLTANKQQYANVNYEFHHQFAMVLIFLGEGFKPDNNENLTVHLTEHVLGAHTTRNNKFTVTVDKIPLSEVQPETSGSSAFNAPKIENYRLPGADASTDPRTVYPVILPNGMEIDYIEVTDLFDMPQKVKPETGKLPVLAGGWKYPLTIKMAGTKPTIYPHEIIDWDKQEEIKIDKQVGIYTLEEFKEWLNTYNAYDFDGSTDNNDATTLMRYGTYDDGLWTFYLRNNIDCKDLAVDNTGFVIKEIKDKVVLDGCNYALQNLTFDFENQSPTGSGINGIGLIGEIKGGVLKNLRMELPTVRNNQTNIPAGCIAAKISGGAIADCTVRQATMMCKGGGKAGVLAGNMTEGQVFNSKFHGMIQAMDEQTDQTHKGIVGEHTGGAILENCINRVVITD
ncbi:fimbrillin family protein [Parabacteroides sp.]